jgi:hypothetical protein
MNAQQTIIGKSNFYQRHGITIRDARNTCHVLGFKPCRWSELRLVLEMICVNKMKY